MGMGIQLGRRCGGPSRRKEGMSSMGADKLKERGWGGGTGRRWRTTPWTWWWVSPESASSRAGAEGGLGICQSNRFGVFGYKQRDGSDEVTGSKIPSSYLVLRSHEM